MIFFQQEKLPYKYDALSSFIDARTMEVHFTKHHKAYIDKLNNALKEQKGYAVTTLDALQENMDQYNHLIRDNGGGHYNHTFFWATLTPAKKQPSGVFLQALAKRFGSLDEFKLAFKKVAVERFGSGWAWLVLDKKGLLQLGSTPNQDNPLMPQSSLKGLPLLALDVWEHAYYLYYLNNRGEYIDAFWSVINWEIVEERYRKGLLISS